MEFWNVKHIGISAYPFKKENIFNEVIRARHEHPLVYFKPALPTAQCIKADE
jgi:hypothetical protein